MKNQFRDNLKKASVIGVQGWLIHNWNASETAENDDIELEFSYTDEEGLIYCFEFVKEDIDNIEQVSDGLWEVRDTNGDLVEIVFYKLTKIV